MKSTKKNPTNITLPSAKAQCLCDVWSMAYSLHSELVWISHNLEDYLNGRAQQEPIIWPLILWARLNPDTMVLFLVSMSWSQYKYLKSLKMTWLPWWICQPKNLGCWSLMQTQMLLSLTRSIISLTCSLSLCLFGALWFFGDSLRATRSM